ncbi:MAG: Smr/MutS family protein [Hyphomicrobiaceae bacterium]
MSASNSGKPPRRGLRPALTPEDRSLWEHVAASVEKRRSGKPRVPDVELPVATAKPASSGAGARQAPRDTVRQSPPGAKDASAPRQRHGTSVAPPSAPARPPASASPPPIPGVDRRNARRIASGAIEIEARLDLHGLTQTAAHRRLVGFLQGAAAKGVRTVLVITGKGSPRAKPAMGGAWGGDEDPGVLRRSVPRWLAEAPLRAIVIACQPAAPRHGGEGAVYVRLRRLLVRPGS